MISFDPKNGFCKWEDLGGGVFFSIKLQYVLCWPRFFFVFIQVLLQEEGVEFDAVMFDSAAEYILKMSAEDFSRLSPEEQRREMKKHFGPGKKYSSSLAIRGGGDPVIERANFLTPVCIKSLFEIIQLIADKSIRKT